MSGVALLLSIYIQMSLKGKRISAVTASGFTAVYLFIYCVHYFVTKLEIEGAASTFLYFGYTSIMVFTFFLLTGIILFSKK
jgi:hypothetical protein